MYPTVKIILSISTGHAGSESGAEAGSSALLLFEIVEPRVHPSAGFGGGLEDADARPDLVDIVQGQLAVEAAGAGDIDLGNHRRIGGVEQARVFEGLVFAFGHAEQNHTDALAQVVARG